MKRPPNNGIIVNSYCPDNPGAAHYVGADMYSFKQLFLHRLDYTTKDMADYLAVVHALGYCVKLKMGNLSIYSSNQAAITWVGEGGINNIANIKNQHLRKMIQNAEIFLKKYKNFVPIELWDASIWGKNPIKFNE